MKAHFLAPLKALPWLRCDFVERIPDVPGSTDREKTLADLEPFHRSAVSALGFDWQQLRRAEQIHDRRVALVGTKGDPTPHPRADSLVTSTAGVLLGIYVADCAAIYVADPANQAIGLAHSGKRGTDLNILPETIEAMRTAFGSRPEDLIIVTSPCIRPPHYEVNFAASIRQQAANLGIPAAQYHDQGTCTASHLDQFYSYRAEQGATGRMFALLGISPK